MSLNRVNGLISLTVPTGGQVQITDGLLTLLGLDDGLGGLWLDAGIYTLATFQ